LLIHVATSNICDIPLCSITCIYV